MLETKDPAIKLFGKKIPLPAGFDELCFTQPQEKQVPLDFDGEDEAELEVEAEQALSNSEDIEQDDDHPPPDSNANPKTPSIDEGSAKSKMTSTEKDQSDEAEKTLKKPDKILPCPRCNSMDTKFCYYNNYNVNQPRHFCKSCQRYWTAGGTMRNVPVGAGRRKNKNSASHYRHITISEALQAAQIDASNGSYQPVLKTNVRVLSFGVDAPVCDSIASVLNLADEKVLNGTRNGFHKNEEQVFPAPKGKENGDDISCASSAMISKQNLHNVNGVPSQIPCIPSVPWPYPWNAAVPPPAFCPPGFPLSFCPAPYWNCGVPGTWNVPWFSPHPAKSPSSGSSSTLGKHSREEDNLKSDNSEKEEPSKQENGCVLVPKTLRIDDPSEAAKSSIWATLGIKNDSISGGGLFKAAFQSKSEPKKNGAETSPALLANPAALSRSRNFHERS